MRPAKTQINLGIRQPGFLASLGSWPSLIRAWRKLGSLATHWAHSKDSDQTGRMPRLIWVFAGRTAILLVLSCRGSYVCYAASFCMKMSLFISQKHLSQNNIIFQQVIYEVTSESWNSQMKLQPHQPFMKYFLSSLLDGKNKSKCNDGVQLYMILKLQASSFSRCHCSSLAMSHKCHYWLWGQIVIMIVFGINI